jgi:tRNA(Arg) A34 adenosine deaminase TadA
MQRTYLTRRGLLTGAACLMCCGVAARADTSPACDDVTAAPTASLSAAEQEYHGVFIRLAMALTYDGWGVDRSRADQIAAYAGVEPGRTFPDYAGHNVGALLVDRSGKVVSFALNRNVQLNSTLEHAEARAIRNAIRLANEAAGPAGPKRWSFGGLLQEHTLYATLEPCAQCAGIMDLANIRAAVYGQEDPAQNQILNVLYNLQKRAHAKSAPLPIRASFMPYWDPLAEAFQRFVASTPPNGNAGATAFLSTVEAYRIFRDTARDFAAYEPIAPENAAALASARAFRERWRERIGEGLAPS